jgi:hypothetical protein
MPSMPELCFVVTCMGRLEYLRRTLPRLASQHGCTCVMVDYSCPDRSGDWVEANAPAVRVIRVEGQPHYNHSAAKNAGAQVADALWIGFLDADILVDSDFATRVIPTLQPGHFYRADPPDHGIWGTILCARDDFIRVGGFDEAFQDWGEEDNDLMDALEFIQRSPAHFPASMLEHLPHEESRRSEFHATKDIRASHAVNRIYRMIKWDSARLLGKNLALEDRQLLYARVVDEVRRTLGEREDSELRIRLPELSFVGLWNVKRSMHYKIERL